MAIVGNNGVVASIMQNATYGFKFETVGDVRHDGEWLANGVSFNEILSAMLKQFNGTAAVQIFVVPVATDYTVADNTLVQGEFSAAVARKVK